jgi:hypothetical protein
MPSFNPCSAQITEVYGCEGDTHFTQIRVLLDMADRKEQSCEAVDVIARDHLADVNRKLADLSALRRELEFMIGQCRHGTVAECRIIDALAP